MLFSVAQQLERDALFRSIPKFNQRYVAQHSVDFYLIVMNCYSYSKCSISIFIHIYILCYVLVTNFFYLRLKYSNNSISVLILAFNCSSIDSFEPIYVLKKYSFELSISQIIPFLSIISLLIISCL